GRRSARAEGDRRARAPLHGRRRGAGARVGRGRRGRRARRRAAAVNELAYLLSLEQFGIKFGLDNIRAIVARLGHPERAFRSVHVAGTNGKGSVTAMVDAALRAAGHRTARYTSPHLVRLNERFAIDGQPVDDGALDDAIRTVRGAIDLLRADGTLEV